MKKVLLIALALITCLAAEAQLRTIKPSEIYKIPNTISPDWEDYDNIFHHDFLSEYYWFCHVGKIKASSTLKSQGSKNYKADNLYDKDYETAWVEGVKGYGIGEWIEYKNVANRLDGFPVPVWTIKILNGYVKSNKAWKENSRVKRLKVYSNGKPKCILELQDSRSLQVFDLDKYDFFDVGATIRFEILDVYPGTKYQDTVISEIYFECYD